MARTLAFEIGTEEIPAFDLQRAVIQLKTLIPEALSSVKIPFEKVEIYSSPRRLIAIAYGVAEQTPASSDVYKGPSVALAYDAQGNPTKAACGFARGKNVDVNSLERRVENGVEYVYAVVNVASNDVAELLPATLGAVIEKIAWPKSCHWGTQRALFTRPVRWLLCLFGTDVIPVEFAGLKAGNTTRGHRVMSDGTWPVTSADALIDTLRGLSIVPSEAEREARIREGVASIEAKTGLRAELPAKTLTEVINLSECPTPMLCSFDESFLRVPAEIIVDAMLMHQRYFPLYDANDKLTNQFIIVTNGKPECAATIIDGNERVVAARLYDAKFFYDEDLKHPLEFYVDKLDSVVFQEALGTVKAKTNRVVALAGFAAEQASLDGNTAALVKRCAYLAKADLVTNAVIEFTSVQGIMGSYYAAAAGEDPLVAQGIADHYKPRFAGDVLPSSVVGMCVAFADKLDTVCGLFAVNQGPTGSSDPFALRRSAIGIVNMLEQGLQVNLGAAINFALASYAADGLQFDAEAVAKTVIDFFVTRTKVMLKDRGVAQDSIDAVCATGVAEPAVIIARACALDNARKDNAELFEDLAVAYARANNLRKADLGAAYDESLMNSIEKSFVQAVCLAEGEVSAHLAAHQYADALACLAGLRKPVDEFFAATMIMDEDVALRENRIKMLNAFVAVFAGLADFSVMAKSK